MTVDTLSNQSVSIENPTGARDKHGQPAFGSATTSSVRFERTYKTMKTEERDREPIHAVMGCPASVTISRGARVTYGSEVYRAMSVAEAIDGSGTVHHREIMLQLWSYA